MILQHLLEMYSMAGGSWDIIIFIRGELLRNHQMVVTSQTINYPAQ